MNFSSILLFITLALTEEILYAGILYASRVDGTGDLQTLIIAGNRLIVADECSRFDYDYRQETLKFTGSDYYLSIDEEGNLVLENQPHPGFYLTNAQGGNGKTHKRVSYYGSTIFQLCEDGLIGFMSLCQNPSHILITYRDINFQPEGYYKACGKGRKMMNCCQ